MMPPEVMREKCMRGFRALAIGAMLFLLLGIASPAMAQEAPADTNGDGIPDIGSAGEDGWTFEVGTVVFNQSVPADSDLSGSGSKLTGPCTGVAISYDSDGQSIDGAFDTGGPGAPSGFDGEQAFTSGNPYKVDTGGFVVWYGFYNGAITSNTWDLSLQGFEVISGGDDNPLGDNDGSGTIDFPLDFTGLITASGNFNPDGAENCAGSGWVEFVSDTNPILTAPGLVATGFMVIGGIGLIFNARPRFT